AAACGTAESHGAAPATPRGCAACARSRRLRRQCQRRARGRARPGPDGSGCPCATSGWQAIAAERLRAVNRLVGSSGPRWDTLAGTILPILTRSLQQWLLAQIGLGAPSRLSETETILLCRAVLRVKGGCA